MTKRALHQQEKAFIIPNPWDVGTARLLAHLGFDALATTSAGYAFSVGQRDNTITRDRMIAHASEIVSATELPVSADLENVDILEHFVDLADLHNLGHGRHSGLVARGAQELQSVDAHSLERIR